MMFELFIEYMLEDGSWNADQLGHELVIFSRESESGRNLGPTYVAQTREHESGGYVPQFASERDCLRSAPHLIRFAFEGLHVGAEGGDIFHGVRWRCVSSSMS